MKNLFKLSLPDNGFGYPCTICSNNIQPPEKCKECVGYTGSFDNLKLSYGELKSLMEGEIK